MDRIEYRETPKIRVVKVTFSLLASGAGFWFNQNHQQAVTRTFGIVVAIFFVGIAVRLLVRLNDQSPRLILDDVGIFDRQLGTPLIPWKDIAAAKVVPFYGSAFIGLLPIDSVERISKFSILRRLGVFSNKVFGLPAFCLNPNGLDVPSSAIFQEVRKRLEATGHDQSSSRSS